MNQRHRADHQHSPVTAPQPQYVYDNQHHLPNSATCPGLLYYTETGYPLATTPGNISAMGDVAAYQQMLMYGAHSNPSTNLVSSNSVTSGLGGPDGGMRGVDGNQVIMGMAYPAPMSSVLPLSQEEISAQYTQYDPNFHRLQELPSAPQQHSLPPGGDSKLLSHSKSVQDTLTASNPSSTSANPRPPSTYGITGLQHASRGLPSPLKPGTTTSGPGFAGDGTSSGGPIQRPSNFYSAGGTTGRRDDRTGLLGRRVGQSQQYHPPEGYQQPPQGKMHIGCSLEHLASHAAPTSTSPGSTNGPCGPPSIAPRCPGLSNSVTTLNHHTGSVTAPPLPPRGSGAGVSRAHSSVAASPSTGGMAGYLVHLPASTQSPTHPSSPHLGLPPQAPGQTIRSPVSTSSVMTSTPSFTSAGGTVSSGSTPPGTVAGSRGAGDAKVVYMKPYIRTVCSKEVSRPLVQRAEAVPLSQHPSTSTVTSYPSPQTPCDSSAIPSTAQRAFAYPLGESPVSTTMSPGTDPGYPYTDTPAQSIRAQSEPPPGPQFVGTPPQPPQAIPRRTNHPQHYPPQYAQQQPTSGASVLDQNGIAGTVDAGSEALTNGSSGPPPVPPTRSHLSTSSSVDRDIHAAQQAQHHYYYNQPQLPITMASHAGVIKPIHSQQHYNPSRPQTLVSSAHPPVPSEPTHVPAHHLAASIQEPPPIPPKPRPSPAQISSTTSETNPVFPSVSSNSNFLDARGDTAATPGPLPEPSSTPSMVAPPQLPPRRTRTGITTAPQTPYMEDAPVVSGNTTTSTGMSPQTGSSYKLVTAGGTPTSHQATSVPISTSRPVPSTAVAPSQPPFSASSGGGTQTTTTPSTAHNLCTGIPATSANNNTPATNIASTRAPTTSTTSTPTTTSSASGSTASNRRGSGSTTSGVIKPVQPAQYKLYMEQHMEQVVKTHKDREERRNQLEAEMKLMNLNAVAQEKMRNLLNKKETNHMRMSRQRMNKTMFEKITVLGVGAFGEVALVRKKDNSQVYAMKKLQKHEVVQRKQTAHVRAERDILAEANSEWVVKLFYSFQDKHALYLVMEYIAGGDLMSLLIKKGIFDEELSRFYIAELTLALEDVHNLGYIHRDIKPDNILITREGHIKLTDFGLCTGFRWTHMSRYYQHWDPDVPQHAIQDSTTGEQDHLFDLVTSQDGTNEEAEKEAALRNNKPLDRRRYRYRNRRLANSLVGTPNYIAPEILRRSPYSKTCDWWSVAVILYEMLVGQPPFLASNAQRTQYKVIRWRQELHIPDQARLGATAKDFILKMCRDPEDRLADPVKIKAHPFFSGIDWVGLPHSQAPYIPHIANDLDTSNFDPVEDNLGSSDEEDENSRSQEGFGSKNTIAFPNFTFKRFFDCEPNTKG